MRKWIFFGSCLGAILLIMACGHKNLVVLIPDPDGSVGQVTVSNAAGSVEMNRANQSTTVKDQQSAPAEPAELDPAKVQDLFGQVLSNAPPAPVHFILSFASDSVELLPASVQQIPEIIAAIQQRVPTRVSVVGHSDTRGDKAYNLDLSLRRAMAVKQQLVERGIDETFVDVSSHGEENPLVKTADNVANAKNRRVEVIVR
jgi:outer membrane protein OmpA-like peptidoglycan-associated protein